MARKAGPAGMAKFSSAFPEMKTDLWIISPFSRSKVSQREALGFWKNVEDIAKYSRYKRMKMLTKEKAQIGIGVVSYGLAYLNDWMKGQSAKL